MKLLAKPSQVILVSEVLFSLFPVSLSDSIILFDGFKSHCQHIPQTLMTLKPVSLALASLLSDSHDSNSRVFISPWILHSFSNPTCFN